LVYDPAGGKIIILGTTILDKRHHVENKRANKIGSAMPVKQIAGSRFELLIYGL